MTYGDVSQQTRRLDQDLFDRATAIDYGSDAGTREDADTFTDGNGSTRDVTELVTVSVVIDGALDEEYDVLPEHAEAVYRTLWERLPEQVTAGVEIRITLTNDDEHLRTAYARGTA